MPRIIYLIECLNRSGGTERIVSLKANWLVEHGYEVTILTTIEKEIRPFYPLSEKIKLHALHIDNLAEVRKQQSQKDVLSSIKNIFLSFRRHRLLKKRLSEYIRNHPCDYLSTLIHCNFIPGMKDGSRKINEIHVASITNDSGGNSFFRFILSLRKWYQARSYKDYYRIVDLTKTDVMIRGNLPNMMVIPNFITVDIPAVKSQSDHKKVISVGRLHISKGYDFLFAAWALVIRKHPDWHLDIYGGVDEDKGKEYYLRLADDNGVGAFVTLNAPVQNIVDKYVESSFYVMSSRYEGFGLVLTEAMACGLPCVSYDCDCGPREIIAHGEDGLLVDKVGDVEGLAKAMIYMIEHPEERKRMGQNAARNVQRFSIDNVMSKWVEVLK
jgi:UDP-glucose:polyglycerol phosphate glucosyltransferase